MFDRRLLQCFDWGLLILTLAVSGIGLVVLYSAVTAGVTGPDVLLFKKQLIWHGGGLVLMTLCFVFDYKQLERFGNAIYLPPWAHWSPFCSSASMWPGPGAGYPWGLFPCSRRKWPRWR